MEISLTVLITGLVVVFSMLIILIAIIKLYSTIIHHFETKNSEKKKLPTVDSDTKKKSEVKNAVSRKASDGIPGEIIAAISAAVVYLEGENAVITKIEKSSQATQESTWELVGKMELVEPF